MDRVQTDVASLSTPTFFQLQEEERYRLARALMDGPGQILANSLVELDNSLALIESNPRAAIPGLAALRDEIRASLADLKHMVSELQPPLLAELGLGPSLRHYTESVAARNGLEAEILGWQNLGERFPSVIEIAVFRIVQEALSNVVQHSGATHVRVQLARLNNSLQIQVEDNGRGFAGHEADGQQRRQLGLVGMNDRATLVGGHLKIFSEAGKGLRVVVVVPYHADQDEPDPAGGTYETGRKEQTRS